MLYTSRRRSQPGHKPSPRSTSRSQVRIVGTLEDVGGKTPRYVEETKTHSSRRMLSMPPFLVEVLAEHLAAAPASEFVFLRPKGAFLRRSNFRRREWNPALDAAGSTLPSGFMQVARRRLGGRPAGLGKGRKWPLTCSDGAEWLVAPDGFRTRDLRLESAGPGTSLTCRNVRLPS